MVAVNTEMPTKCSSCPANIYYENLGGYICEYVGKTTDKDERWEKRLEDCPLVEIVTCKDCKYNAYQISTLKDEPTRICCRKNRHAIYPRIDGFCADAERRE